MHGKTSASCWIKAHTKAPTRRRAADFLRDPVGTLLDAWEVSGSTGVPSISRFMTAFRSARICKSSLRGQFWRCSYP
jgi:hypothetical protein